MKRELRDRWVAALRSGEYEQGQDALRDDHGRYCCLGVLCDVMGVDLDEVSREGSLYAEAAGDSTVDLGDPPALARVMRKATRSELARMNDAGTPFSEIADYIQRKIRVSS